MTKAELAILAKVFDREYTAAIEGGIHLVQFKSKLAKSLAERGYLVEVTIELGGRFPVKVTGYELTHLGRMTYCDSCGKDAGDE